MRYLLWILRLIVFLLLLGFAVKNDQSVMLRYFFGYEWNVSLLLILLCVFGLGILIGVLSMLGSLFRQRRELLALRQKLQQKTSEIDDVQHTPIKPS